MTSESEGNTVSKIETENESIQSDNEVKVKKSVMNFTAKEFIPKSVLKEAVHNNEMSTTDNTEDNKTAVKSGVANEETDGNTIKDGKSNKSVELSNSTNSTSNIRPKSLIMTTTANNTTVTLPEANLPSNMYPSIPMPPNATVYPIDYNCVDQSFITNITTPSPGVVQPANAAVAANQLNLFSHQFHSSGGSSPHSYQSVSPPIINNNTFTTIPSTSNGTNSSLNGEHYVMVHVNLGETFSIRVGDQIQNISGPATVRMISNSGPPTPMPMQVPPGHMVQQIVDENGILTHVILSPLHHQPTLPHPPQQAPGPTSQCMSASQLPPPHHHHHHIHSGAPQPHPYYTAFQNNAGSLPPVYSNNYSISNGGGGGGGNAVAGNTNNSVSYASQTVSHSAANDTHAITNSSSNQQQAQNHAQSVDQSSLTESTKVSASISSITNNRSSHTSQHVHENIKPTKAGKQQSHNRGNYQQKHNQQSTQQLIQPSTTSTTVASVTAASATAAATSATAAVTDDSQSAAGGGNQKHLVSSTNATTNYAVAVENSSTNNTTNNNNNNNNNTNKAGSSNNPITTTIAATTSTTANPNKTSSTAVQNVHYTGSGSSNANQHHHHHHYQHYHHHHHHHNSGHHYSGNKTTTSSVATDNLLVAASGNGSGTGVGGAGGGSSSSGAGTGTTGTGTPINSDITGISGNAPSSHNREDNYFEHFPTYPTQSQYKFRKRRQFSKFNYSASTKTQHHYIQDRGGSPISSADEVSTILTDEEKNAIRGVLNTIEKPEVSEVEARSALIHIICPKVPDSCVATINPSDFTFQLHFAERNPDSRYNCVFYGEAVEISLQDLKPATDYYVKVCCIYESVTGSLSNYTKFATLPSEPNPPKAVVLQSRTRNSIQVKWSSPVENGSKVSEYILEYSRADSNTDNFIQGYRGNSKTFKIQKLKPSTEYLIRLAAHNSYGQSKWSEVVSITTAGTAPPAPDPPCLARADTSGILLTWKKRGTGSASSEETFCLEMMDEATGYGFITVFNGPEVEHYVENLRRNTQYRFRLAASNQDGRSKWSEVVTLSTRPDLPGPVKSVRARARSIQSTQFVLVWEPPEDDGGLPVCTYRVELDTGGSVSSLDNVTTKDGQQFTDISNKKAGNDSSTRDSERDWAVVYEGADREFLCKNMVPGSCILARVSAKSSGGMWGPSSGVTKITMSAMAPGMMLPPRKDTGTALVRHQQQQKTGLGIFQPGTINLVWEKPEIDGGAPIINFELCQWTLRTKNKVNLKDGGSLDNVEEIIEETEEQIAYTGSKLSHQIVGLIPGALYRYRIRASNKAGHGKWSSYMDATSGPSAPEAPHEPPTVLCKTAYTASVNWLPPYNANGAQITEYRVEARMNSPGSMSSPMIATANVDGSATATTSATPTHNTEFQLVYAGLQLNCEVRNLQPSTSYTFRVQAVNRAGVSNYSPYTDVVTLAAVPSSVTGLKVDAVTMHSVQLVWREPACHGSQVAHYMVEVSCPNYNIIQSSHHHQQQQQTSTNANVTAASVDIFTVISEGTDKTIGDLIPDTVYKFRVQAVNGVGAGPFCNVVKATTMIPPPAPPRLECLQVQANSIKLRWYNEYSPRQYYISKLVGVNSSIPGVTSVDSGGSSVDTQMQTNGGNSSCSGLGLVTGTTGSNGAALVNANTAAIASGNKRQQHKSIHAHSHQAVSGSTTVANTSMIGSAGVGVGTEPNISQYQLQMSRQPDSGWSNIYTGSLQFHKHAKLLESTTYYFRIMASNEMGYGDYSEPFMVTTEKAAPPAVRPPKVMCIGPDSCIIEWPALRSMNNDPIVYILQLLTITEKDSDYRQLWKHGVEAYRGSETRFRVGGGLQPNTEYLTRVCAVRLCSPSTIDGIPASNNEATNNGGGSKGNNSSSSSSSTFQQQEATSTCEKLQSVAALLPSSTRNCKASTSGNSSPVTELLGPFSKSVSFTTMPAVSGTSGSAASTASLLLNQINLFASSTESITTAHGSGGSGGFFGGGSANSSRHSPSNYLPNQAHLNAAAGALHHSGTAISGSGYLYANDGVGHGISTASYSSNSNNNLPVTPYFTSSTRNLLHAFRKICSVPSLVMRRWIGPWTDNHFIVLILIIFTGLVVFISHLLLKYLKL